MERDVFILLEGEAKDYVKDTEARWNEQLKGNMKRAATFQEPLTRLQNTDYL